MPYYRIFMHTELKASRTTDIAGFRAAADS